MSTLGRCGAVLLVLVACCTSGSDKIFHSRQKMGSFSQERGFLELCNQKQQCPMKLHSQTQWRTHYLPLSATECEVWLHSHDAHSAKLAPAGLHLQPALRWPVS